MESSSIIGGFRLDRKEKPSNKWNWIMLFVVFCLVIAMYSVYQFYKSNHEEKPTTDPFSYSKLPVLGSASAPVRIVEFGDFKCPDCKDWEQNVFPQLKKDFIDTGKAKLYFMDFQVIRNSETAELVGRSIYHQSNDAFWQYYTAIYANQGNEREDWATESYLLNFVSGHVPHIDIQQLKQDVQGKVYQSEVDQDKKIGKQAGVHATPTIFINGKMVESPQSYDQIKSMIGQALDRTK
jgi:protein-disulfide isomerase